MNKSSHSDGEQVWELKSGVLPIAIDGGGLRLIDLDGHALALSPSGSWLLDRVLQLPVREAVQSAAHEFQVAEATIAADIDQLLQKLQYHGLVQARGAVLPATSKWIESVLSRLLRVIASLPLPLTYRTWLLLAIAAIAIRWLRWSPTVAAFRRAASPSPEATKLSASVIDAAVRSAAALHPLRLQCKERGLVCWMLAGRAGLGATLVVGFRNYPFEGHCWCLIEGSVASDFADRCAAYSPAATYELSW